MPRYPIFFDILEEDGIHQDVKWPSNIDEIKPCCEVDCRKNFGHEMNQCHCLDMRQNLFSLILESSNTSEVEQDDNYS